MTGLLRGMRSQGRGLAVGFVAGAALMAASSALAVSDSDLTKLREAVLYAISALAVDTEKNAHAIVGLQERIDDLQAQIAELVKARQ